MENNTHTLQVSIDAAEVRKAVANLLEPGGFYLPAAAVAKLYEALDECRDKGGLEEMFRAVGGIESSQQGKVVDHRELLRKYMRMVCDLEGVTFVASLGLGESDVEFTELEKAALQNMAKEIRHE